MVVENVYTLHTLNNGLRVVLERMPDVRSAAAGFLVQTGARDETRDVAGVSHFLEHMMFKGTGKRTWREITIEFDRMGSTYNAFTSEDRTVYYGWVRKSDIGGQLELLADMMRSALPVGEFETEKKVILEEIAMSRDSIDHVAFDFLQESVFEGHPIAWPVLGYEETIRPLTRDRMWEYFERRYVPENMILIVAGNVEPRKIIGTVERLCGGWATQGPMTRRTPPKFQRGPAVLQLERFKQQVVALTFPTVGACDPRSETAEAVATILGGENSRFFWSIVQKGIAPRAGAHYLDYADFGAMILYGACQPENVGALVDAMRAEADRICGEGVTEEELMRVKSKRRTALAVESEAPYYRLGQLMDDMEYHGAPRTVEQMLAEVDAITVDSVRDYLSMTPLNVEGHLTSVGPRHWPG